jgi:hypothetical protein
MDEMTYPRARKIRGRDWVFVIHVVVVSIYHQYTVLVTDEKHTRYEYWKRYTSAAIKVGKEFDRTYNQLRPDWILT